MTRDLKDEPIISGSASYPTVYQLNTYKGHRSLDIRKFFRDKSSNELKPTRKGISLNKISFEALIVILKNSEKDISSWLAGSTQNENKILSNLKKQSEYANKVLFEAKEFSSKKEKWRGTELYKVENYGDKRKLLFNENHDFMKIFNALDDDARAAINILLISLDHAMSLYDKDGDVNFGDLNNEISENWGILLKSYAKKLNE